MCIRDSRYASAANEQRLDAAGALMASTNYTVVLLAGGDSAERDVSLSSSRGIAKALREAGHRVLVCDPARPHIAPTEYDEAIFGESKIGAEPPVIDIDCLLY